MADHYSVLSPALRRADAPGPPNRVAAAGYLAAMLINPNNHALDGGPGTSTLEVEVVESLAGMFGLQAPFLGHLTSSGTIANLEALWVARELHPDRRILYGAGAHYTHGRMCGVLRAPATRVAATPEGRIDLDAVEAECRRGDVGTVVLTLGSTGVGAIDRSRAGARICASATACACTSTAPTAASSPLLVAGAAEAARRPGAVRRRRLV